MYERRLTVAGDAWETGEEACPGTFPSVPIRMTNPLSRLLGHLGVNGARERVLAQLIEASDLPGEGWRATGSLSRRVGEVGYRGEEEMRARRAGYCMARRAFEQDSGLWAVQDAISTYVSVGDAESVVANMGARLISNSRAEVRETGNRDIEGLAVAGVAHIWAHEQTTTSDQGTGAARYLAANIDQLVFAVGCAGHAYVVPWDDVIAVAES